MERVLLCVNLCLLCLSYAMFADVKVKDNETLIYHWDVHHKIFYYCQFGRQEEIGGNFERQCFRRNKQMQHILPNGSKTFPYVAYGSSVGFVLKCVDISLAELHNCSKLLYTTCSYTCKGSTIMREMACELRGPNENVTAQWSVAQPCVDQGVQPVTPDQGVQSVTQLLGLLDKSVGKSSADPVTDVETTSTPVSLTSATNKSIVKSGADPVTDVEATSTPVSLMSATSSSTSEFDASPVTDVEAAAAPEIPLTTLLAWIIPTVCVVAALLIVLCIYLRRRRRRKSRKLYEQPTSPDRKNNYKDAAIVFSSLDAEYKQPLVVVEGEDILQKSTSGSEASASEASSEILQDGANGSKETGDVDDLIMDYEPLSIDDIKDIKIESALDDFVTMSSNFNSWEKTKQLMENDKAAESSPAQAQPGQCSATMTLLQEQPGTYRRNLRAQLEVISCRTREQALIGFMEQNMHLFGYQSLNELKVLEQTYERQVDEKVSDVFLRILAAYGVKIGCIMEYFYQHRNWDSINVILQVHRDCPYCEMFRKPREVFVCG